MEWDDEAIERIKQLWAEGHSTAEIGRRMGVTKNAIVGKAHRLILPPRPSPIRRDGPPARPPRRAAPPRVCGPTLPPMTLPCPLPEPRIPELRLPDPPPETRRLPPSELRPAIRPVPAGLSQVARGTSRLVVCCWPIGEPGTADFHFCDAGALAGKPYCAAHAQVAYVKVRDRREEAA